MLWIKESVKAWHFQPILNSQHKLLQSRLWLAEVTCKMWLMICLVSWRQSHYFITKTINWVFQESWVIIFAQVNRPFSPQQYMSPRVCLWNQTYISTLNITQVDTHTPACDFPWGWRWPFPGLHWGPCTEWPVSRCPSLAWTNHCPCPQEMGEQSGPLILNPHQAHCNTHAHTKLPEKHIKQDMKWTDDLQQCAL